MTNILKSLYEERFYANWQATPEYQELADKERRISFRFQRDGYFLFSAPPAPQRGAGVSGPLIGQKMIDQIMSSQSDLSYHTNYEWFREGFRLGAALMLELL